MTSLGQDSGILTKRRLWDCRRGGAEVGPSRGVRHRRRRADRHHRTRDNVLSFGSRRDGDMGDRRRRVRWLRPRDGDDHGAGCRRACPDHRPVQHAEPGIECRRDHRGARAGVLAIAAQCPLRARRDRAREKSVRQTGRRSNGWISRYSIGESPSAERASRGSNRQPPATRFREGNSGDRQGEGSACGARQGADSARGACYGEAQNRPQDFENVCAKLIELEERIKVLEGRGTPPRLGVVGRIEGA